MFIIFRYNTKCNINNQVKYLVRIKCYFNPPTQQSPHMTLLALPSLYFYPHCLDLNMETADNRFQAVP